jgi:cardiolipin synthase
MPTRTIAVSAIVLVAVSLALGEALHLAHARPDPRVVGTSLHDAPAVTDAQFERMLELYTGTHIDPGNSVEQLLNGDGLYRTLLRDLGAARRTITLQMYYAKPGRVADEVATVLSERARAGVRVLLLLDAFGSEPLTHGSYFARLRQSGVEVALLRPLEWSTIHSATDRSHVRAVVVDGHVGYTGGFGLADMWLGDGHHADQWRESNVRFEGPAVLGLQAAFAGAWAEATGELIAGDEFFPSVGTLMTLPGVRAGLLFTAPTIGSTGAERFLALAIRAARRKLYITNSYFVPNASFEKLLEDAVARGVDVRVITAGSNTDVKTTLLAARYLYGELLARGIRIYEYQPTMMHAKTIVVDDVWSTIGSMNFDSHSLAFNNESNLVVLDPKLGAEMDSVFFDDMRYAKEITASDVARRSWWERAMERGATMLSGML